MNSITGVPMLNSYYQFLNFNPLLIIVLIVVILAYFMLFGSLGGQSADEDSNDEQIPPGPARL